MPGSRSATMLQRCREAVNDRALGLAPAFVAALAFLMAPGARAEEAGVSPERERALALGRELGRSPRGDGAIAAVAELLHGWDLVEPGLVVELLEALSRDRRADRAARDAADLGLAAAMLRTGRPDEASAAVDRLGALRRVAVVGPFDNEGDSGMDRALPPEERLAEGIDFEEALEGSERPVRWREVEVSDPLGVVRLDGYVQPAADACAFVASGVELPRGRSVEVRVAAQGALVLWIDGVEVVRDEVHRELYPDRYAVTVALPPGTSRIVAKVCGGDEPPALLLRLTDARGEAATAGWEGSPAILGRAPARLTSRPRPVATAFDRALGLARERGRGDLALAARILAWTDGDDPAEPLAPDLAASLADEDPSVDAALLAAALAPDRNAALERLGRAAAAAPADLRIATARARLVATGPCPSRALPLTAAILERAPGAVEAAAVRARLFGDLGLPLSGLRVVEGAMGQAGEVPALVAAAAQLAAEGRLSDRARELQQTLARLRFDSPEPHRALAEAARDGIDPAEVATALEALERVAWNDVEQRTWAAQVWVQAGLEDRAEASLLSLVAQAPEAHDGQAALARLLAGLGRSEEAIAAARAGLALRPQDSRLRELLGHLMERDPFEDELMEEPETFLARRGSGGGEHARVLLDLTVVRVHPSGLSSRFRQQVVEVLDEQGASDERATAFAFVPEEQEVTLRRARVFRRDGGVEEASGRFLQRLADPEIRMYYDETVQVVEMPRLRPGDVVEVAYRVDDVGSRNLLGDYFGDLVLLQGEEPRRRVSYVMIHPPGRRLHVAEPDLPGLERGEVCDGERCVRSWVAEDVPGISPEENMPPLAEVAARLHVSSYGDWETIGRWYWGLVRDQLVPDDSLRAVVAELVDGLEDEEARVRAVHRWVVEHTRYVALEFGIHGYQPYRVTQVVDRGFGDCKDKASLLVTMLGLAGVDASLVLLRTRGSGRVPADPPSLALFDHAIAYVPSLDLYLDGTAEQSGTRELPWMDQGVTALLVAPGGESRLVETPVDPPERNVERRVLTLHVRRDGSALVEGHTVVGGANAARMRFHFQAPALRRERLEASLASTWPGATLAEFRFDEVSDRERPVDLEVTFLAPRAATRTGDRLAVDPARRLELTRMWARRSSRRTALELGEPPHVLEEERLIDPDEGLRVVAVPGPAALTSPFGAFSLEATREGDAVRVRARLVLAVDRVEARDYPAFRAFCQQVDEALERPVVLAP